MPNRHGPDTMKRYEKFADEIAELIRSGVLAPGEKVPSVRHASRTYGVSPSTVFQAYYLLEDRGLIQARARSEEHTSELQSLMRISYAVFCLKKKKITKSIHN